MARTHMHIDLHAVDDPQARAPQIREVALGVSLQVARRRHPHVPLPPAREVDQHDARDLPALAYARAVADHEPRAVHAVRQTLEVLAARVRHALELQARQRARVDRRAERLVRRVIARRQRDGGQRRRLGDVAGVLDAALCACFKCFKCFKCFATRAFAMARKQVKQVWVRTL